MLIAGDHILPHITPNLSPDLIAPDFHPLESFLSSLARVEDLPVRRVCPAHGRPFIRSEREGRRDAGAPPREIGNRAAGVGRGAAELRRGLPVHLRGGSSPFDRLLALNETYVHLIQLERESLIRREMRNGLCLFARMSPNEAVSLY